LIEAGLSQLKQRGAEIVLVLGDPNYYSRVGFRAGHNIEPPYELAYPEAWMALELAPGKLERAAGVARCASALSSPEHW
jgi:putative acetyltransferase